MSARCCGRVGGRSAVSRRRRDACFVRPAYARLFSTSAQAVVERAQSLTPPPTRLTEPLNEQISTFRELLNRRSRILALTGAGISTESGIPDYRSPGRPPHNPITHQAFMRSDAIRKRYWARSMVGYHRMQAAQPNSGHVALAAAQRNGRVHHIVTQNVDALHEKAGASHVVHLHGNIDQVQCQSCKHISSRAQLQRQLEQLNPAFAQHVHQLIQHATTLFQRQQTEQQQHREQSGHAQSTPATAASLIPHNHDEDAPLQGSERSMASLRPDGDIELQNEAYYSSMNIPPCDECGGVLKPDVVFFGANVPREVHAQVDGQLLRINFAEGQEVAAGDRLAEIDPRLFQAAYDQAVANTARDAATLANARRDLERYAGLGNAIAQQTVDTQRATVRQAEATVAADRAAAASAKTQLGYTRIVAPIPGRTGLRQVDAGNIVHPGDTNGIVTIAQLQPISVLFSLPQQDLPKVAAATARGPVAVLATDADGKVLDSGALALVDNAIDQSTGTVRLKATLPNASRALWPGAFTNVRLLSDVLHNALYIAAAAVQRGPDGTFVYVFDPKTHKVALRKVTVALTEDQVAVIGQGLGDGDQVVVDNAGKLNDGMTVALPGETPADQTGKKGGKAPAGKDAGKSGDDHADDAPADKKPGGSTAGRFSAQSGAHNTEGAANGEGAPNSGPGEGSAVKGAEGRAANGSSQQAAPQGSRAGQ